jgi:hypothetical protein
VTALDEAVCAEQGSPPFPGAMGYRCTETPGHLGIHVADNGDGRVLDTWPRSLVGGEQ